MSNTRKLAANYWQGRERNNCTHNLNKHQHKQLDIIGPNFNSTDVNEANIKCTTKGISAHLNNLMNIYFTIYSSVFGAFNHYHHYYKNEKSSLNKNIVLFKNETNVEKVLKFLAIFLILKGIEFAQ